MKAPLLAFRAVSREYGDELLLRELDLTVLQGQHTALLGRSGSGKSTLLRLIAGIETPSSGDIFLGGVLASSVGRILVPPHARGVAMVFQDLALWPSQTVFENVLLGLDGQRLRRADRQSRASAALGVCGIERLADRLPGSLSGGEQQRVALARAMAVEPTLLLLDEPFAGLDLPTKRHLLGELRGLALGRGMTLVLVTHDPSEAFTLCTHALALEGGRILEEGTWRDVLRSPRSEVLQAFKQVCQPSSTEHGPA